MFDDEPGERVTFKNSSGQSLAGWLHKADNAKMQLVIQAHGHPSSCHSKHVLYAEAFKQAGLNALRFDFAGSGASEGEFEKQTIKTAIDDMVCVIRWAKEQGYEKIGLMGASFGGPVVLAAALEFPDIERIVLRSPAPDLTDETEVNMFSSLAQWENDGFYEQPNHNDPDSSFRISFQFFLDAKEYVMFEPAKEVKARTLVIAGTKDEVVPFSHMQRLATSIPHALMIVLEGADHSLAIDGDLSESVKLMVGWFLE